jgi:hypothetical protein
MKNLKIFFVLLFVFSDFQKVSAQNETLNFLQAKVDSFNKKFLPEKIYVHTDKDFYTAGEILWFKIYVVDGFFNKQINLSKVAYFEILNQENVPVARAKIKLNNKGGDGSVQLPLTLGSGYYTIKTYTNWMKNFGEDHFFVRQIEIINPLKGLAVKTKKNNSPYTLDLFPEGGNLVNGLPSKIAYKLSDEHGNGVSAKGFLLNDENDTLSTFVPFKFGMGSFDLLPEEKHNYKVVFLMQDGNIITKPLPQVYNEGYVMSVEEAENNKLKITVRSNVKLNENEIYLIVQNHQIITLAKESQLSSGITFFSVNETELGRGISQLTIFNSKRQPVCERLFFLQSSQKISSTIKASKDIYGPREKVSLSTISNYSNASLAVYQLDSLQTKSLSNIATYLWLESELKGTIENPEYYFSDKSDEIKKASDYLMLTHGWRRFKWETILNHEPPIKFAAETTGPVITAKVVGSISNQPVKDILAFLSIPETRTKLFVSVSDNAGSLRFHVKDFYGSGEVILQTNQPDSFYKIEIDNPFFENHTLVPTSFFSIKPIRKSLLENYSINMQATHIYKEDSLGRFITPEISDTFPFYGRPVYSYNLEDYTRFTTMEEVLREYVREVNVGVKGSALKFKLLNEDLREFYTDNILVTVDGVPVFNPNKVFSYDPLKFSRLDIIPKNYILGTNIFYAVASFSTYQGSHEDIPLDPKAIALDYEGLQIKREFYSPDYSSEQLRQNRVPDLRSTLFWAPNANLNEPIRFYTCDNKGQYIVIMQGISNNGEPITETCEFEVK